MRDIRPLELPVDQSRRLAPAPRARRLATWAGPVVAAAVVVTLAIALVTVRQVHNESSVPPSAPSISGAGQTIPQYYAALTGLGDVSAAITKPSSLVIGNDRTGGVLAVMFQPDEDGSSPTHPITLRVYSVQSGEVLRSWTGPANASRGFGWDALAGLQ